MLLLLALACQRPAPPASPADAAAEPTQARPDDASATDVTRAGAPWQAPLGHDHPWTGRIWSVEDGAWIDEPTLREALRGAAFVLLGEQHDHPDHHRLQARLVSDLVEPGTPVLFEQLDVSDPVHGVESAGELAEAVAWAESGWPDFALYEPVFSAVYARGGRVLPAHPRDEHVQLATQVGIEGLPPELQDDLQHRPLSDARYEALLEDIVQGHCGTLDYDGAAPMVDAQILKDAFMAGALVRAGAPALLIAGGGHTRPDRGVPHHLDAETAVVLFREVRDDVDGVPALEGEADYVWFTARLDDEDPCERFREQLREMRFR